MRFRHSSTCYFFPCAATSACPQFSTNTKTWRKPAAAVLTLIFTAKHHECLISCGPPFSPHSHHPPNKVPPHLLHYNN